MNVIQANFDPLWRREIAAFIKQNGVLRTESELIRLGADPSFARAICRSIMRKKGW